MYFANPNIEPLLSQGKTLLTNPKDIDTTNCQDKSSQIERYWLLHMISNDMLLPFYKSPIWLQTRQDILERDKYECQLCKSEGRFTIVRKYKDLNRRAYIHHMCELKLYPELCLNYNNLVTLCFNCHEKTHERFKYEAKKPEIYDNFDSAEMW